MTCGIEYRARAESSSLNALRTWIAAKMMKSASLVDATQDRTLQEARRMSAVGSHDGAVSGEISVEIIFSGGLETLFDHRRKKLTRLCPRGSHLSDLITTLADECGPRLTVHPTPVSQEQEQEQRDQQQQQRAEKRALFYQNGSVRPGILVLINDTDWELEGQGAYVMQDKDTVLFVSTLHGG